MNTTLIGDSTIMHATRGQLTRLAPKAGPLLITGETGVGKELAARLCHEASGRRNDRYFVMDCTTLTPTLAESKLFGHLRGSFTGAVRDADGIFKLADGGTVFLDEIGELPLELQPKLLRVLNEGEISPVGGSFPIKVSVRVLAATHRDLAKMVEQGRFREDLYYRLSVFKVSVPPLRERLEDIPALVERLCQRIQEDQGGPAVPFSRAALEKLRRHSWPGNVRELRNTVERALAVCDGPEVQVENLIFDPLDSVASAGSTRASVPNVVVTPPRLQAGVRPSREDLVNVLWDHNWVVRAVAAYYDVAEDRIFRWIRDHLIRRPPGALPAMANREPFTPGRAVIDPARFFGREHALAQICAGLRSPMVNMLVQGPKRRGKTSTLLYLAQLPFMSEWRLRKDQRTQWVRGQEDYRFAYVDFHAPGMLKQELVLQHILSCLDLPLPERCGPDEFLRTLTRRLRGNAVILLDNFERVRSARSELDEEFWAMLRSLTVPSPHADVAFLIATDAKSAKLLAAHQGLDSPFFNVFTRVVSLPPMSDEEAWQLVASSPQPFPEEDARWIIQQAAGCPNCLQILCRLRYADEPLLGEQWREEGLKALEHQACRQPPEAT